MLVAFSEFGRICHFDFICWLFGRILITCYFRCCDLSLVWVILVEYWFELVVGFVTLVLCWVCVWVF